MPADHVLVVAHAQESIGPVEDAVARQVAEGAVVHLVWTDGEVGAATEFAPRRLQLMLLLARLADRGLPVTGEDAWLGDGSALIGIAAAVDADRILTLGVEDPLVLGALRAIGVPVQPLHGQGGEDPVSGVVVGA